MTQPGPFGSIPVSQEIQPPAPVELVLTDGEGEVVLGPFPNGLIVNECSIYEPGTDPSSSATVAEWTYGEESEAGWEAQRYEGWIFATALVRGAS